MPEDIFDFKLNRIAGCIPTADSIELMLDYGELNLSWADVKYAFAVKIKTFEGDEVPLLILTIEGHEGFFYIDGQKISPRLFSFQDSRIDEKRLEKSFVTPKTLDLTEKRFKWVIQAFCSHLTAAFVDRAVAKCIKGGTYFLPVFSTMKDAAIYCSKIISSGASSEEKGMKDLEEDEEFLTRISIPSTQREEWNAGTIIEGQYTVQEVIRGGMGIVYIVFDTKNAQFYAMKTFLERYLWDDKVIRQFVREAEIWINLEKHPNIVKAELVKIIEGKPYIFLEYVSGTTLEEVFSHELPPVKKSLSLTIQFCEGMDYAFRKLGLIHRDIKPSNCFITKDEVLKITDFGLGKIFDAAPSEGELVHLPQTSKKKRTSSSSTTMVGTLPFMAPELFSNLRASSVKSDIYSFGVLLYLLLTGINPFYHEDEKRLIQKHMELDPVSPQELNYEVPTSLANIALRCLAKKPENRYDDFEQIKNDLALVYEETYGMSYELPHSMNILSEEDWIIKGESLASIGHHMEAMITFDQALSVNPASWRARIQKGKSLVRLGHNDEALAYFDELISENPESWEAWFHKSEALIELDAFNEALAAIDRALLLNPENPLVMGSKGELLSRMNCYDEALGCFDQALLNNPKMEEFWESKGRVLQKLHRFEEASECFLKAIEINPRLQSSWSYRGEVLSALGHYTDSISAFRTALTLDPDSIKERIGIGSCYREIGNMQKALLAFDQALKVRKTDPAIYLAKARLLEELAFLEDALRCLKEGLRHFPSDKRLLTLQAMLYLKTGSIEKTEAICNLLIQNGCKDWEVELLKRASSIWIKLRQDCLAGIREHSPPDNEAIIRSLSDLLSTFCSLENALHYLTQISGRRKNSLTYYRTAQLQRIAGDLPGALISAEKAVELSENFPEAKSFLQNIIREIETEKAKQGFKKSVLGNILKKEKKIERDAEEWMIAGMEKFQGGDNSKALDCFRQALRENHDLHACWFFAGTALKNLGDLDQAGSCFDSFIERYPKSPGFYRYQIINAPPDISREKMKSLYHRWIGLLPSDPHAWVSFIKYLIRNENKEQAYAVATELNRTYVNRLYISKKSPHYWNLRGYIELYLKNSGRALRYFARSKGISPSNPAALLGLGKCFELRGNILEAMKIYEDLGILEDSHITACYHSAHLYLKQKKAQEALIVIERALKANPGSPLLAYKKAQIYVELQDFWNFFGYYTAIYDLDVSFFPLNVLRAIALVSTEKLQEATSHIKNALSSNPQNISLLTLMGYLQLKAHNAARAIESFDKIILLDKNNRESIIGKGAAYFMQERYEDALPFFQEFLDHYPDDPHVLLYLGAIHYHLQQYNSTEHYFIKAAQCMSRFTKAWSNMGIFFCKKGQYVQAQQYVEKALRIDTENGHAWLCRGKIQQMTGNLEEAYKNTEQGLYHLPHDLYGWVQKGIIEYMSGNCRQSLKSFMKASEIDDKQPLLWYDRGVAALFSRDANEARKSIDRSLLLEPQLFQAWLARGLLCKMQDDALGFGRALDHAKSLDPARLEKWVAHYESAQDASETLQPCEVIPLPFDLPEHPQVMIPEPLHLLQYADLDKSF